jgi:hypothetical protein
MESPSLAPGTLLGLIFYASLHDLPGFQGNLAIAIVRAVPDHFWEVLKSEHMGGINASFDRDGRRSLYRTDE